MAHTNEETWVAVADLHGHLAHFQQLLAALDDELGDSYRLCTLGDYVDNGPDVPALLDFLIELKAKRGDRFVPIIGNHDLAMIRALGFPGTTPDPAWWRAWGATHWNAGLDTPRLYAKHLGAKRPASAAELATLVPSAHVDFLRGLPWHHDTGTYLFVHAGLLPGPLEPQVAALHAKQLPSNPAWAPLQLRGKEATFVAEPSWPRLVVSGHRKLTAPRFEGPNRLCLSGEVDETGTLYAAILPRRDFVTVSPKRAVSFERDGKRLTSTRALRG